MNELPRKLETLNGAPPKLLSSLSFEWIFSSSETHNNTGLIKQEFVSNKSKGIKGT